MRKYRQDNNGGDFRTKAINGGMHLASMRRPFALCLVSALVVYLYWISSTGGEEKKETKWSMATAEGVVGGIGDVQPGKENALEIKELGRFAVEEHNKKANDLLEFVDVVKAKEQTVAGTLYYLTIEAVDGGQKKLYEAKIWVKPWMHFKELQEFNQLGSDTSAKAE